MLINFPGLDETQTAELFNNTIYPMLGDRVGKIRGSKHILVPRTEDVETLRQRIPFPLVIVD